MIALSQSILSNSTVAFYIALLIITYDIFGVLGLNLIIPKSYCDQIRGVQNRTGKKIKQKQCRCHDEYSISNNNTFMP